jgi:pimeloyl-ACP methyl ester carboxylesterase
MQRLRPTSQWMETNTFRHLQLRQKIQHGGLVSYRWLFVVWILIFTISTSATATVSVVVLAFRSTIWTTRSTTTTTTTPGTTIAKRWTKIDHCDSSSGTGSCTNHPSLQRIYSPMFWSQPSSKSHRTPMHMCSSSKTTTATTHRNFEDYVPLPNGLNMQVLWSIPISLVDHTVPWTPSESLLVPTIIVLLHGSFHAAWCWEEYYMPYFSRAGYIVVAPSWRGTGSSTTTSTTTEVSKKTVPKIPITQHVADLQYLLQAIPNMIQPHCVDTRVIVTNTTPIHVMCHSFGGIVLMKYFERYYTSRTRTDATIAISQMDPTLSSSSSSSVTLNRTGDSCLPFRSIVMMCSVPPSGNGKMTMRFLRRSLRKSWNITKGLAMKQCCWDTALCRQLFFTTTTTKSSSSSSHVGSTAIDTMNGITDDDIQRYQSNFRRDSRVTIDLLDLAKQLPSKQTTVHGQATYIDEAFPPCLVLGANDDYIIDTEALYETAQYFGSHDEIDLFYNRTLPFTTAVPSSPKVVMVDSPHDIMLGTTWINSAQILLLWLQQNT